MDTRTYTFNMIDDSIEQSVTVEATVGSDWPSIIPLFEQFLRACGYVIPHKLTFELVDNNDEYDYEDDE